jgi:hypothetical protein
LSKERIDILEENSLLKSQQLEQTRMSREEIGNKDKEMYAFFLKNSFINILKKEIARRKE